jgi:hypothetical protein
MVAKMELENDVRKVNKLQTSIRLNREAGVVLSKTTETKTTRTVKPKKQLDLAALAAALKAAGITKEMMASMGMKSAK